jgi:imidazolonepropionase-like amidohydrolase
MSDRIVFTNARLLDGQNPPVADSTVIVEGKRITYVGVGTSGVETRASDRLVDVGGRTLMPGMVQSHFHTGFGPAPDLKPPMLGLDAAPSYFGMLAVRNARTALDCGVTSIIGSSNPAGLDVSLKEAGILGIAEVPRIIPCTREFMASGDYADGSNRSWYMDLGEHGVVRRVDGVVAMRQACGEELGRGAEVVKLSIARGHGASPTEEHAYYTQAEIDAAVEVAETHRGFVRAHCPSSMGIKMCAAAGVRIIDHADRIDESGIEAVVLAGAFITPSMLWSVAFLDFAESWDHSAAPFPIGVGFPQTLDDVLSRIKGVHEDFEYTSKMLPKMIEGGVKLLVGDDFGFPMMPHGDYVSEYEVYTKRLGIPSLSVLQWATKNGAEAMGMGDELGTIEVGKFADLLIVDGDPSADIGVLREGVQIVMLDGEIIRDRRTVHGFMESAVDTEMEKTA